MRSSPPTFRPIAPSPTVQSAICQPAAAVAISWRQPCPTPMRPSLLLRPLRHPSPPSPNGTHDRRRRRLASLLGTVTIPVPCTGLSRRRACGLSLGRLLPPGPHVTSLLLLSLLFPVPPDSSAEAVHRCSARERQPILGLSFSVHLVACSAHAALDARRPTVHLLNSARASTPRRLSSRLWMPQPGATRPGLCRA
ncbi:hypothetical protein F5148DRAFT_415898 [Russula earlei]|uniref:Uncharacterized protein n=1 Tax=Russula earlei TaxID=71964 RepID=A0ACC0U0L3_9AGAM|nr:hypothetical protein F5148DRAFT_415898 [Russula earlei]